MDKRERDRLFCEAFEECRAHVENVVRRTGWYLAAEDLRDIVQEVMIEAWEAFESAKIATFRFWIVRMARFRAIDRIRRRASHAAVHEHMRASLVEDAEAAPPEAEGSARYEAHRITLDAAVARLPTASREVVQLHREGWDHARIAGTLGIIQECVRTRLSRGLAALRDSMIVR